MKTGSSLQTFLAELLLLYVIAMSLFASCVALLDPLISRYQGIQVQAPHSDNLPPLASQNLEIPPPL